MNEKLQLHVAESWPSKHVTATTPVREPDFEPTRREEVNAANKLPQSEQMKKFEQDLEEHDPGNQPS
jgi:hypothetical protein